MPVQPSEIRRWPEPVPKKKRWIDGAWKSLGVLCCSWVVNFVLQRRTALLGRLVGLDGLKRASYRTLQNFRDGPLACPRPHYSVPSMGARDVKRRQWNRVLREGTVPVGRLL